MVVEMAAGKGLPELVVAPCQLSSQPRIYDFLSCQEVVVGAAPALCGTRFFWWSDIVITLPGTCFCRGQHPNLLSRRTRQRKIEYWLTVPVSSAVSHGRSRAPRPANSRPTGGGGTDPA